MQSNCFPNCRIFWLQHQVRNSSICLAESKPQRAELEPKPSLGSGFDLAVMPHAEKGMLWSPSRVPSWLSTYALVQLAPQMSSGMTSLQQTAGRQPHAPALSPIPLPITAPRCSGAAPMCFGKTRLLQFVPGTSCYWRTRGEHGSLSFLCPYLTQEQKTRPDIHQFSALAKALWLGSVSMPIHRQSTSLMLFPLFSSCTELC